MIRALRILWAVGMDLSTAVLFLVVWFQPYALGEQSVRRFAVFYLVEFIVIHATLYWAHVTEGINTRADRFRAFLFSGILYTIVMGVFSLISGNVWVLVFFWGMMFGHFPTVVSRPPGQQDRSFTAINWGVMFGLWLVCLFLTHTFVPIPAFGITPEVIAAVRPSDESARDVLVDEPYRCIAFGAAYFSGLALWSLMRELTSLRFASKSQRGRSKWIDIPHRILQRMRSSTQPGPVFDPVQLDDPIALQTEWRRMVPRSGNLCTPRLVAVSGNRVEFKITWGAIFLPMVFILIGILLPSAVFAGVFLSENTWEGMNVSVVLPGLLFVTLLGAFFVYGGSRSLFENSTPIVFDTSRGIFYHRRKAPDDVPNLDAEEPPLERHSRERPSLKFEPGVRYVFVPDTACSPEEGFRIIPVLDACRLEDIHALQLLCEHSNRGVEHHELNIVLKNGGRINVMSHGSMIRMCKDAQALAAFLGVPLWDAAS